MYLYFFHFGFHSTLKHFKHINFFVAWKVKAVKYVLYMFYNPPHEFFNNISKKWKHAHEVVKAFLLFSFIRLSPRLPPPFHPLELISPEETRLLFQVYQTNNRQCAPYVCAFSQKTVVFNAIILTIQGIQVDPFPFCTAEYLHSTATLQLIQTQLAGIRK